ncbi:hypothetical protein ACF0H5_000986 [Mactra antiquata]
MDYKIKVGLICVVTLFMACGNVIAQANDTATDNSTVTTAGTGTSTSAPGKSATSTSSSKTSTAAPTAIKCKEGKCNETTCNDLKNTCDSNDALGCKVEQDKDGVFTFSCVTTGSLCKESTNTKCCASNECNPYQKEKSSANTNIGSLISISLMMLFIRFL